MEFLEALEICLLCLESIQAGKRVQVHKAKLPELKNMLSQIMSILKDVDNDSNISMVVEGLFNAITATMDINMEVLPDSMKASIETGLINLKLEIAEKAFEYFTFNEFEPTEEIIPLLREVVACHYNVSGV